MRSKDHVIRAELFLYYAEPLEGGFVPGFLEMFLVRSLPDMFADQFPVGLGKALDDLPCVRELEDVDIGGHGGCGMFYHQGTKTPREINNDEAGMTNDERMTKLQ